MSWSGWIAVVLAVAGLAGGGGIVALARRDWQKQGALEEDAARQDENDRSKDALIKTIEDQRDHGIRSAGDADRVWDRIRARFGR
jgi:hypothetical protein